MPGFSSPRRSHSARTDAAYVEIRSRIPEIAAELAKQSNGGAKDLADAVSRGAKERVPVGATGDLKEAIHVTNEALGDWRVVAGDSKAWYGHIVEHGSVYAAPHPFLLPAMEAE